MEDLELSQIQYLKKKFVCVGSNHLADN